jgi:hypothetical protein
VLARLSRDLWTVGQLQRCGRSVDDVFRKGVHRRIRSRLARGHGEWLLIKPVRNAILASRPAGIWRMSDEDFDGEWTQGSGSAD